MTLTKLHGSKSNQMRVVGLMSGSGSNLRKIIEFEKELEAERGTSPFTLVGLFTDKAKSNAVQIGQEYDLPVIIRDIKAFYAARGKPKGDREVRREFDAAAVKALAHLEATVAAYGGYMSIATDPWTEAFLGINVHPADLSIKEGEVIKYTGDHAVRDAILARENQLRATTHIIEKKVDYGKILMRSAPMEVELPTSFDPADRDLLKRMVDLNQERLKKVGDWVIFPRTLLYLAEGRYAIDEQNCLYFDEKPIPTGVALT